jgi:hypothetical protein
MRSIEATPSIPSIVSTVGAGALRTGEPEHCGNCRFWAEQEDKSVEEVFSVVGECRRNPPVTWSSVNENSDLFTRWRETGFPITDPSIWCGEYEVRK